MASTPGTAVDLGSWAISRSWVQSYLGAVGNTESISLELELTPPIALSAWALGSMLNTLSLPAGTIHSRQEMETHRPVNLGETVQVIAHQGKPAQRSGLTMLAVAYTLEGEDGSPVQSGRSTVLTGTGPNATAQVQDAAGRPERSRGIPDNGRGNNDPNALPTVTMTITQPQLNAYAEASGDNNPLHLDADFAAATQFQGIIAHGMLTLAAIGKMMEERFGRAWLESGALNVRFKGAAYIGDTIESYGRITRESEDDCGRLVSCAVGVKALRDNQELITGTASIRTA